MRRLNFVFYTVLLFFVSAVIWLMTATIDQTIRLPGEVEPLGYVQTLQARYPGKIQTLHVRLGDEVSKGELLVTFDSEEANAAFRQNQLVIKQAEAALVRLIAESNGTDMLSANVALTEMLNAERQLFELRQRSIRSQLLSVDEDLALVEAQRKESLAELDGLFEIKRLKLEELSLLKPLVDIGAEPRVRLMQLQQELQGLSNSIASLEGQSSSFVIRAQKLKAAKEEVLSDFRARAYEQWVETKEVLGSALEKQKVLKSQLESMEVAAPFDGVVTKVFPKGGGAVISTGEPLVEFIPRDTLGVMVRGKLSPKDLAAVSLGQSCRLSLINYDFTKHGNLTGEVFKIAQNTTKEESGAVYYEILVETTSNTLDKSGVKPQLTPGMTVDVAIVGETRTALDYLLKPLKVTAARSFSE